MAEVAAAPSAPAPSTSAQPSAQPTPGGPTPTAPAAQPNFDNDAVRDAAPPDTTTRLAKPIKPIPRLPGVFPDDDPFPAPPSDTADAQPRTATPPRGPDGRFVAPSSATPGDGEHTRQPETKPADAADGPFEFAGERFPNRAAAEQNFKSLRGQYRPIQSLAKSLGGVDKIVPQFQSAAESARGWKAAHDAVVAELTALRSGKTAPATTPTPTPQPDAASTEALAVDWELYAEVKKLATERGEPWKADQWLYEQQEKVRQAQLQRVLDERDAPLKAQQEKAAVVAQTQELFDGLSEFTLEDGSPAFPELHDEEASYAIGQLWASLGLPREHALTRQGGIAAIALYRMSRAGSQARAAAPSAPPTPTPPPTPPVPTDTHSAASLVDGRPTVASVGGNGSVSAEAARIQAALRSTHSPNRSVLGFDV